MLKYTLYFMLFCVQILNIKSTFLSPFSPKKGNTVICQDNSNILPTLFRGGELSCPDNATILIYSAKLDLSSEQECPLQYNTIPLPPKPTCNKLVDTDVKLYLKKICDTKKSCQFSFQSDLPQLKCFDNKKIVDIGAVYSSIKVTYLCKMIRLQFWPLRRNKHRRKRVNLKKFRTIKKLKNLNKPKSLY